MGALDMTFATVVTTKGRFIKFSKAQVVEALNDYLEHQGKERVLTEEDIMRKRDRGLTFSLTTWKEEE